MGKLFVSNSKGSISRGIQTILIGGVFLFIPGITMKTIMIIIGGLLVLSGLVTLLLSNWKRRGAIKGLWSAQGIMNIIFGIVFIISPSAMIKIFMIFIGIILLIMGLLQLAGSIGMLSRSVWAWLFFLIGLMTFFSGIYLLSNPFKSAETILPFLGALLMLNGVSELFMWWKSRHRPKIYKGSEVQDIPYEEV